MKVKASKKPEEYSARDLLDQWYSIYKSINDKDYSHTHHIGLELKSLKDLQANYDVFLILVSMQNYIKRGGRSIQYFAETIDEYLPRTKYYELIYLVTKSKKDEYKKHLKELLALEAKWLPTSENRKRMKELEKLLYGLVRE